MQKTLVIIKPSAIQRGLVGKVISRFENKGLQLVGLKMMLLSDEIVEAHYAHLRNEPFFKRIKDSMQVTPVFVLALKGIKAIEVVRNMSGSTNSRKAIPGTIRGDYSMSHQENIIHTSDSEESSFIELARFFKDEEMFDYTPLLIPHLYSSDEY
ncbi:MAG: nucleoside-diphosphate kinase [Candidatus Saccharimonadaceae bacterium]